MTRLSLVLFKEYFDALVSGSKTIEYRQASEYWRNRLIDQHGEMRRFDEVEFRNGYRKDSPRARFVCGKIVLAEARGMFEIHVGKRL